MKLPGLLMIVVIALMSMVLSAGAATTSEPITTSEPEECKKDFEFAKVSYRDITVSWHKTCFGNDESYDITLISEGEDQPCNKYGFPCVASDGNPCELDFRGMSCSFNLKSCSVVAYTITGTNQKEPKSRNITTAPRFNDNDWVLNSDINEDILYASWGPPGNSPDSDIRCANKARVSASCSDQIVDNLTKLDGEAQEGSAELNVTNCAPGPVTLRITYMSGEVLTETTNSVTEDTKVSTTTTPVDSTTNTAKTESSDSTTASGDLKGGEIAGIVIGSLLGGVILIGGGVFVLKKKKIGYFK